MKAVYVVDEIGEVVSKVSANLTTFLQAYDPLITGVHYQHGHPKEIIETLKQRDSSETFVYKKYPLIALFQDFQESKGEIGFDSKVKLHLIIARASLPVYKAKERYDKNFKPVLYPIYLELLRQLNRTAVFQTISESQISHEKIDRLYWGREGLYGNDGNIFNDSIDCIEIKDLELLVKQKIC